MKRRTVQVNLLLLALAALWVYVLADNWSAGEGQDRPDAPGRGSVASAASGRPSFRASTADAAAIAGHHLFHSDRHNDLPEEAVEELEEQRRPAPVLMGTLAIGGESYALMVSGGSRNSGRLYRRLKVGESLDGHTLVRIEADRVVMKSGAREIRVGMHNRSGKPRRTARTPNPAPTAAPSRTTRSRTTAVGSGGTGQGAARRQPARSRSGTNRLPGTRRAPLGTVRDGKRLVERSTPFGKYRVWVDEKSK